MNHEHVSPDTTCPKSFDQSHHFGGIVENLSSKQIDNIVEEESPGILKKAELATLEIMDGKS